LRIMRRTILPQHRIPLASVRQWPIPALFHFPKAEV
jgi:hypothetical protein